MTRPDLRRRGSRGDQRRNEPDGAADPSTVRGVAKSPDASLLDVPLVGPVFRSRDPQQIRPARDWALFALLVLYPLWRLLGANLFIVPFLAVPMALELYRRRNLRFPAGFNVYVLLIFIALISVTMINKTPPGAIPPQPGVGRYLAWALRVLDFISGAVVLLYVGNLTERELPTRRVVKWLATLFVTFVVGGILGMALAHVSTLTPIGHVLPGSLRSNSFVKNLVTLQFAQNQAVLGSVAPRPDFPLNYTNAWGECIALLLPWFLIAVMRARRTMPRMFAAGATLAVAVVPTIYSLNRGMWIGLGIGAAYLLIRLVRTGRRAQVAAVLGAVALVGVIMLTTGLGDVIGSRLEHPRSNDGRANINHAAIVAAEASPIIGYGGMTGVIGSQRSIAIGPTADCPSCGNLTIGGDGQMWQLLITQGFAGAILYVLFYLSFWWKYRRDPSPIAVAGTISILMMLMFMTVYTALELPLMIVMVGLGLWWRSARAQNLA
ncbi:MAG TPA: O-antigen ligase family protein [Micromonosporaceae bacterium]